MQEQLDELTIADIKGVVELPVKRGRWWLGILGVAGAAVVVAMIVLHRWRRGRQVRRVFKAAHEIAYEELERLKAEQLGPAGNVREFYGRISGIMRWYIEQRFKLRAPERTTQEFVEEAQRSDVLTVEQRQVLGEFLERCDMVKFARYGATTAQMDETFDVTSRFIETTRSEQSRVDVTDEVPEGDGAMQVRSA